MTRAIELLKNSFGVSQLYQHDVIKDGKIIFKTPSKPGAYRIFAIVSNANNQCSVANIAFIVE